MEQESREFSITQSFPQFENSWKRTVLSEYETIEIAVHIIDLLETLHSNKIIHSNLSPGAIFLEDEKVSNMKFVNLYHCSW